MILILFYVVQYVVNFIYIYFGKEYLSKYIINKLVNDWISVMTILLPKLFFILCIEIRYYALIKKVLISFNFINYI